VTKTLCPFSAAEADKKTTRRLMGECIADIWLSGSIVYLTRNVVERVPFPLDGVAGFVHGKVKELTNAVVFTFVFMYYQKNLRDKLIIWVDGCKRVKVPPKHLN